MGRIFAYARVSSDGQTVKSQLDNIHSEYGNDTIDYKETYTGSVVLDRPAFSQMLKVVRPGDTIVFNEPSRMGRSAEETFGLYVELFNKGINLVFLKAHHIDTDRYKDALESVSRMPDNIEINDDVFSPVVNGMMALFKEALLKLAKKDIEKAFIEAENELKRIHQRTSDGMRSCGACNVIDSDGNKVKGTGSIAQAKTGMKYDVKKAEFVKSLIIKHCEEFGAETKNQRTDPEIMAMVERASKGKMTVSRNSFYKYKKELREQLNNV